MTDNDNCGRCGKVLDVVGTLAPVPEPGQAGDPRMHVDCALATLRERLATARARLPSETPITEPETFEEMLAGARAHCRGGYPLCAAEVLRVIDAFDVSRAKLAAVGALLPDWRASARAAEGETGDYGPGYAAAADECADDLERVLGGDGTGGA